MKEVSHYTANLCPAVFLSNDIQVVWVTHIEQVSVFYTNIISLATFIITARGYYYTPGHSTERVRTLRTSVAQRWDALRTFRPRQKVRTVPSQQ